MKNSDEAFNKCDECSKESKNLYAHEGFVMTSFVVFLCDKCYKLKYGITGEKDINNTRKRLELDK